MYDFNDKPELNITPLVDIMLVLLAILMVTAPVIEFEEPISLPKGSKSQQVQSFAKIDIIITKDRVVTIDKKKVDIAAFPDTFVLMSNGKDQETPVHIRADKGLVYDDIVFVLKSVKEAGFFKVSLVTDGWYMEKKPMSFILSGIISFSFYILICFLVFYYMLSPAVKTYSFESKATVLELDVIVEKSDKKRVEKKEDKKVEKEEVVEKETSIAAEKKPDLKSLFGSVKVTETKVAKEEINNVEKSADPKRFKAKFEKEKKSSNVKIDSLITDTKTTTDSKSKSATKGEETDEYFSKVNELLNEFTPSTREANLKAVVLVIISPSGQFDYSIKSLSNNESFDASLKAFLEDQKNVPYPVPKQGNTVRVEVDFKSEG